MDRFTKPMCEHLGDSFLPFRLVKTSTVHSCQDGALRQRLHLRGGLGRLDSPMLDVGCEGGRFVVMSHVFLGKELLTSEIP